MILQNSRAVFRNQTLRIAMVLSIFLTSIAMYSQSNKKVRQENEKVITVKVTYTVKDSYAEKNRQNIEVFMKDFKTLKRNDFRYTVYVLQDNKTFVHISMYANADIQKQLLDIPSFKSFQQQRDDSGLEAAPTIEVLTGVNGSHDFFQSR